MEFDIITCEYPPKIGGVAAYTELVALGLAARGAAVRVFVPHDVPVSIPAGGVTVCAIRVGFGIRGLFQLDRAIGSQREGRRVLVQYVPTGYGWRGMNVPFCLWIYLRRAVGIEVMFHEVMLAFSGRIRTNLMALVNRLMALLVARGAKRAYVSSMAWMPLVRQFAGPKKRIDWLPIPSILPEQPRQESTDVPGIRNAAEAPMIGHFGAQSYHDPLLRAIILKLAASGSEWRLLLIGKGSHEFLSELIAHSPGLSPRLRATGPLPASAVASYLSECDLSLQPYPDGITTRRTSAMASLGLGIPVVTNLGPLTEEIWGEEPVVFAAKAPDADDIVAQILTAFRDEAVRRRVGSAGQQFYADHFMIGRTLEALLA